MDHVELIEYSPGFLEYCWWLFKLDTFFVILFIFGAEICIFYISKLTRGDVRGCR